jgi:hypothetical protein
MVSARASEPTESQRENAKRKVERDGTEVKYIKRERQREREE